ncbi:MAG: alkaline phosphatase family protein, partial [Candidatus Hydrogenedentes bacterium]|nr:alkaline phosphatase family protein [Candidatus Hydrogenedentota bacterium]
FIRRDPRGPAGPMPLVGTGRMEHPSFNEDQSLAKEAWAEAYRKGDSFWLAADQQGIKSKILNVPFVFPADNLKNGLQLCALGVPDLRGTTSTFFVISDSFSDAEQKSRLSGGENVPIQFDAGDTGSVNMPGPRDVRVKFGSEGAYTEVPLKVSVDRKGQQGTAEVNGRKVELQQGQWSEWLEWDFKLTQDYHVHSITRFYPLEIGQKVRIYMSCQQFHPEKPFIPFSTPPEYTKELKDRYGLYKTIGWAYDTHALRQDGLTEDAFLGDVAYTMGWREKLTLDEIERGNFDLLVSVWTATDRVGHMFWRFRDPKHPLYDPVGAEKYGKALENCYKRCDEIVGNVMAKLEDTDTLMILSDHGFESWRTGFNVNTWLAEQGYLKISDPVKADRGFLMGMDWANSQAYSVGLGSVYINEKGRETGGIVDKGESGNMIAEIKDRLLQVKDPVTGQKVFTNVYTRDDYKGIAIEEAPDIALGYNRYFQSAKAAAKGAAPENMWEVNDDKWSGEHAASDVAWIPGIFFCNRLVEKSDPNILDLGVTALNLLECDVPSDFEGDPLV